MRDEELGMLISVVRSIPGSAAERAETAAAAAEASAETAAASAYAITLTGCSLNILDEGGE